jgi:hypothetical protein
MLGTKRVIAFSQLAVKGLRELGVLIVLRYYSIVLSGQS